MKLFKIEKNGNVREIVFSEYFYKAYYNNELIYQDLNYDLVRDYILNFQV